MAVPGDPNYLTLTYNICLSDASQVQQLWVDNPNGLDISPRTAATRFNAEIAGIDGTSFEPPLIVITGGYSSSSALALTADSVTYAANLVPDAYGILHASTVGTGGVIAWKGLPITKTATPTLTDAPLSAIRFLNGFELDQAAVGADTLTTWGCHDASRVVGGRGLPVRDVSSAGVVTYTPTASTIVSQWTQFYVKVRTLSTNLTEIYRSTAIGGVADAVSYSITSTGALRLIQDPDGAPSTLYTSDALSQGVWHRIDLLEDFNYDVSGTKKYRVFVYIDKVNVTDVIGPATGTYLTASQVGNFSKGTAAAGAEFDIDDWSIREYPDTSLPNWQNALDWRHGTHIFPLRARTLSSDSSVNWTGTVEAFDALRTELTDTGMSCSTSSSNLVVTVADYIKRDTQLGIAGITVVLGNNSNTASSSCVLGARLTVSGTTTTYSASHTTLALSSQRFGREVVFSADAVGDGTTAITPDTIELLYDIGTVSGTQSITGFQGLMACLGSFGPEDDDSIQLPAVDSHQAAFPQLAYATAVNVTPPGVVAIEQGTYTGNGTVKTFTLVNPPYFLYIHRSGSEPVVWTSSMETGRLISKGITDADQQCRVLTNVSQTTGLATGFTVELIGSHANSNSNGITYKYITFSDPGGRFMRNGVASVDDSLASKNIILSDGNYLPEAAFLFGTLDSTTTTSMTYYTGPGYTSGDGQKLDAASASSIMSLSTGLINNTSTVNLPRGRHYNLWRSSDGTYDGAMDVTSYTGNGAGARTITLDLNGSLPCLVVVVPHGGAAYHRNSLMTGSNSELVVGGTTSTTAITSMIADGITVNATLNANAVVYDVWALSNTDYPVPTVNPPAGPYGPADPNGWWLSTEGFTGGATVIASTQRPKPPRDWSKLANWATSGSSYLGGFPAASAVFNNHIVYPGNTYVLGTDQPPLRIFDGLTDRGLITLPPTSTNTVPKAIISLLRVGDTIYLSSYDSGTTNADFAGRVFSYSPLSNLLTPLGSFSGGEIPYALAWHMGRLWVGTNKSNGTAGKVYFIRPGIDTSFTTDHTLATDTVGGALSMASFQGKLYVGSDNAAAAFAKILVRDSAGAWSTSLTATGGTARVNNGFPHMTVFQNTLVATYWNPDTTNVAKVYTNDGTGWVTAYTGATTALRPYILQFEALGYLYILGGAKDRSAFLMRTNDLTTFTNLTAFLSGPITNTVIPTYGLV